MATMVTSTRPPATKKDAGGADFRDQTETDRDATAVFVIRSRTATATASVWVGLASVMMMFTSLSSAYIVRSSSSSDWVSLPMPRVLIVSTI